MSIIQIYSIAGITMLALAAHAQIPAHAAGGQVAVHVSVKNPPGVTNEQIVAGMQKSVPIYEKVPGLQRKYFTMDKSSFGGIYLFRDRASAESWFSDAWRAKSLATYGTAPVVTYFDVPLTLDNSKN